MLRKLAFLLPLLLPVSLHAETGRDMWLRYAPLDDAAVRRYRDALPAAVTVYGNGPSIASAGQELASGIRGMLARSIRVESFLPSENTFVIGTLADLRRAAPQLALSANLEPDGFWLKTVRSNGIRYTVATGENDRGVLYGVFALLRRIAQGESVADLDQKQNPYAPIRWVNQWDNLDGTIERGYGGRSIF